MHERQCDLVACVRMEPTVVAGVQTHQTQLDVAPSRYRTHWMHRMQSPDQESWGAPLEYLRQHIFLQISYHSLIMIVYYQYNTD